jgi:hypothetical protein
MSGGQDHPDGPRRPELGRDPLLERIRTDVQHLIGPGPQRHCGNPADLPAGSETRWPTGLFHR